ncbi:Metallo-beta-lactamase domain-containing protein 2 [Branchiostoma belcheri]|nr:Metallo-beta-lactamase domain-containing protein 2 [Branchiostoma belcheri]
MRSLIDWLPYSCVSDYVQSCRRLQTLAPDIHTVFPGHFETFSGQRLESMLTDYINSAGVLHSVEGKKHQQHPSQVLFLWLLLSLLFVDFSQTSRMTVVQFRMV